MASERLTKEGDLIIEVEDGPWTFPATVECLPKEAESYAEKVCAPWRQYIRACLAAAREATAYERAAEHVDAMPDNEHVGDEGETLWSPPCQWEVSEAIRSLATDDQTAALEAVKWEALRDAVVHLKAYAPHLEEGPEHDVGYYHGYQTALNRVLSMIEKGQNHE